RPGALVREALPPLAGGDDRERDDDDADDRDGLLLCWRASFFAWVRKLLALPAFGVSTRMRPGFGRKRNSSSTLKSAPPARNVGNCPISGHGAGRNPAKPRLCAMTWHAGSRMKVPPAPPQNSVQTRACPETAAAWCRFPLSCPPPFLTFPPLRPGMQPGATLPDCTPEPARTHAGTPSSWRSPVVGPRDEHAAVSRL